MLSFPEQLGSCFCWFSLFRPKRSEFVASVNNSSKKCPSITVNGGKRKSCLVSPLLHSTRQPIVALLSLYIRYWTPVIPEPLIVSSKINLVNAATSTHTSTQKNFENRNSTKGKDKVYELISGHGYVIVLFVILKVVAEYEHHRESKYGKSSHLILP